MTETACSEVSPRSSCQLKRVPDDRRFSTQSRFSM